SFSSMTLQARLTTEFGGELRFRRWNLANGLPRG
ncbi:MAG: hypothetical protein ACI8P0_001789, partial [Planctomycetaceae bacterium]